MSLTVSGVSHAYRAEEPVLVDIGLEVADGESVALVGPSGSGKTTLLSIIGLLQAPTAGTVQIDGQVVPESGNLRTRLRVKSFSWVFQTVNTLGRRSALDNVALSLLAGGSTRADANRQAAEALERVGLASITDRSVQQLSGGELQRVCIARGLVGGPRFVCADEPTGQLDQATSHRVLEALWAARAPNTSVIIATHDRQVTERCERILRLVNGRIEEEPR